MKAGFGSFDLGAVGARLHPSGLGRVPRVPGSLNPDFSKTFSCTGPALFIREAAPLSFLGTRSLLPPDQLHSFFFSPWSASWYSSDCCSYGLTLAAATSIVPPSPSGNAPIKRLYFQISPPKPTPHDSRKTSQSHLTFSRRGPLLPLAIAGAVDLLPTCTQSQPCPQKAPIDCGPAQYAQRGVVISIPSHLAPGTSLPFPPPFLSGYFSGFSGLFLLSIRLHNPAMFLFKKKDNRKAGIPTKGSAKPVPPPKAKSHSDPQDIPKTGRDFLKESQNKDLPREPRSPRDPASPLRPPRLNTTNINNLAGTTPPGHGNNPLSAPSSPISRRLGSERLAPASYLRHSRVLSMSSNTNLALDADLLRPLRSLRRRMKTILSDLPPELLPVVNLINAQRLRTYISGSLWLKEQGSSEWQPAEATLTGTELALYIDGSSNPRYINIQDCSVLVGNNVDSYSYDLTILQDFDNHQKVLRFDVQQDLLNWLAALHLAKYEQTSLNEAFTAVILSLKGPELLDIFTLLAHKKRFARFEWCNLRLPQVSSKWIKTYMAIIPGDGKKKGRVEIYTNDKINKKSLIMYVNDADAVYNVYPEDHRMIDSNGIMKLEGQVFVNKDYEHLFSGASLSGANTPVGSKLGSRTGSNTSLSSLAAPAPVQLGNRSRSTSVNSSHSFFMNSPTPNKTNKEQLTPGSPPRNTFSHFYKKQSVNKFVCTNYIYLMPIPHPGVSAIEIMIRNFVHIVDAFKLYGRPSHLNSDKKNTISMLFGLPSLPHYGYLATEDAFDLVEANFETARIQNWTELEWRNCLKEYLLCKQADGPYKGFGNIADLYDAMEGELPTSEIDSQFGGMLSPKITFPHGASRVASPPPVNSRLSQSFLNDQFGGEIGHLLLNDTQNQNSGIAPALKLNDNKFLGGPFEYKDGDPNPRSQDEMLRSLEPIVDLPTPMDDKHAVSNYFGGKDGKLVSS